MSTSHITLRRLRAAYRAWAGAPTDVLKLRRAQPDARVPTELDILFFQPAARERLRDREFFTSLATAGMSTRVMAGPTPRVELFLNVQGRHDPAEVRALARALGELAVLPFRDGAYFAPNMVVSGQAVPLFAGMSCLLLTNWGLRAPTALPGLSPAVHVLWVKPLYESEAAVAAGIGDLETYEQFMRAGVNWDDPKRRPLRLRARGPAAAINGRAHMPTTKKTTKKAAKAAKKSPQRTKDAAAEVGKTWRRIELWLKQHSPRLLAELQPGASDGEVAALEGRVGATLPTDYSASLKLHNGAAYLNDYQYLSVEGVKTAWTMMTDLSEKGTFRGRTAEESEGMQRTWWHRGWIPFAQDGGGNMLCLDTAPTDKGRLGQVLSMELQGGPALTEHKSFLEWLQHYSAGLSKGKYKVGRDGHLTEKMG